MTTFDFNRLREAEWNRMIADTAARFDDLTLKRGFQLYKQGQIHTMDADSVPGIVTAIAEEGAAYPVTIDLDSPAESVCECPAETPCKHLAAALMAYAESRGRSVHLLANAHSTQQRVAAEASSGAAEAGPRSEARLRELGGRLAELSVAQWQDWIADCARSATSSPYQANYSHEVHEIVHDSMPEVTPEEAWLIELHVGLFLLRKQSPGSHAGYFAHVATSETIRAIASHLTEEVPADLADKHRERLLETAAYLHETATSDAGAPQAYLDVYVELWVRLIAPVSDGTRLFDEELARLVQAEEAVSAAEREAQESGAAGSGAAFGSGPRKTEKLFPLVARAWMHFWLEEDQQAWQLLEAAERHRLKPDQVLRFLRALEEAGAWVRLEAWLIDCATERVGRHHGSLFPYGRYWDAVIQRLPEAEEHMWHAITSLLPYSRDLYEEMLMRYGHWRQWVDYQLSRGSDPLDFRAKDLQPIEKGAPEALLPFYHQGAERYVLLKNRDGYKRAVKLLKRLAKLYKKVKREDRWEAYIETFSDRYSRLRALQEELRKGKLIP